MQQRNKRMAALAAAAALCLTIPAAGASAEPWTYEVDSEMSGYGVEYYADVGFENPLHKTDTAAPQAAQSPRAADSGISTYSGEGAVPYAVESWDTYSARMAVAEAALQSTQTDAYTVTIPSELEIGESGTGSMNVRGTVQPYHELTIEVSPQNGALKNGGDAIGYSLTGDFSQSTAENSADSSNWTASADADANAVDFDKSLTATLNADAAPTMAGTYTDTLNFTMSCRQKQFTITYNAGDGTGEEITKAYACGTSEVLAPKPDSFSKEGYTFTGWALEETGATTVYSQGMPIDQMEGIDSVNTKDGGKLTLYAQWANTEYTINFNCEAITVYKSKLEGQKDEDVLIEHGPYEAKKIVKRQLTPGTTLTWTLDELQTLGVIENKEQWVDQLYTVTVPEDLSEEINVNVDRRLVWLDVNATLKDKNGKVISRSGNLTVNGEQMGSITVTVNNMPMSTASLANDYWRAHPLGSTASVVVTDMNGYKLTSYTLLNFNTTEYSAKAGDTIGFTLDKYDTAENGVIRYALNLTFVKDDGTSDSADTLLPSMDDPMPVVVTLPSDAPAADGETAADDPADAGTGSTAPDETPVPTRDAAAPVVTDLPADTPDELPDDAQETTPDELMIQDADELLASFSLSDPELPGWDK